MKTPVISDLHVDVIMLSMEGHDILGSTNSVEGTTWLVSEFVPRNGFIAPSIALSLHYQGDIREDGGGVPVGKNWPEFMRLRIADPVDIHYYGLQC